jgi:hypothetical protein
VAADSQPRPSNSQHIDESTSDRRDGSEPTNGGTQYYNKGELARSLGHVLGRDFSSASTQVLQEILDAVSHETSIPVGNKSRHPQVQFLSPNMAILGAKKPWLA